MKTVVLALLLTATAMAADRPSDADALTATIHTEDAERFASLFAETGGQPSAAQLQSVYLDHGSHGLKVFTPHRIVSANRLAAAIAEAPEDYAQAIETCLPVAKQANADLRSIYLGLHGALPKARLPQIYVVFGSGNSGGTAGPGAQVLGLEVLCRISSDQAALRRTLRHFFAHETVHAFQQDAGRSFTDDILLNQVLVEGAADFIAQLVTGEQPDAARSAWADPREAELWRRFQADIALTRKFAEEDYAADTPQAEAMKRWVGNYNSAPDGWPGELGYWMGLRIWERYYDAAPDKKAALQEMLTINDPRGILSVGKLQAS